MNWTLAITLNREALLRIFGVLAALAGLGQDGGAETLQRHVRLKILRVLRPFESALRRLIVVQARNVAVSLSPLRPARAAKRKQRGKGKRNASFPLIDRLQHTGPPRLRYAKGPEPRIWFFDGTDPPIEAPPPPPSPDDAVDATPIRQRLQAVKRALDDLQGQAKRLARWQARRAQTSGPGRIRPLRPGRPPGHRARRTHEIDAVLAECQALAQRVLYPDTS